MTLRFRGDCLDPCELTACVGIPPTTSAIKGGTWTTGAGAELVATTGFWRLRVEADAKDTFDDKIANLFSNMSCDLAAWRDLSSRFDGNLFVGVFLNSSNEGLTLTPETSLAIGQRGLSLQLDIYEREAE